jgi:hypothetical protein
MSTGRGGTGSRHFHLDDVYDQLPSAHMLLVTFCGAARGATRGAGCGAASSITNVLRASGATHGGKAHL